MESLVCKPCMGIWGVGVGNGIQINKEFSKRNLKNVYKQLFMEKKELFKQACVLSLMKF